MKTFLQRVPVLAMSVFLACAATRSGASVDPWEFEVYPYSTNSRGMAEFESDNAVISSGHSADDGGTSNGTIASQHQWYNSYEFSYGLTDRIEAAVYLDMAQPNGSGLQWAGDNFRFRGRLFDEGVLPVDLGWYLELEWHKVPQFDDAYRELEFRPIIEKDFGRLNLMANPKFEKVLAGAGHNQGVEFGYVLAAKFRASRRCSPSIEFYGGTGRIDQPDPLAEQQHYTFAAFSGELPGGLEYDVGVGFGLTRGSDHTIFKVNLELERFLGTVFGPSRESGWFF